MRRKIKFIVAAITACFAVAGGSALGLCRYYSENLPDSFRISDNEKLDLGDMISVRCIENEIPAMVGQNVSTEAELLLFDAIPIKSVTITECDAPLLVPSGQPFGIKILSQGVMVVGVGEIACAEGGFSPAAKAGLRPGDIILSVNGQDVLTNSELQKKISESNGLDINFEILRKDEKIALTITPAYSEYDRSYQAGIWVRDSSAGIGTMTYYNPQDESFAGLGHPICDVDTGGIVPLSFGEIVDVDINGVLKGSEGSPGELKGSVSNGDAIGTLSDNNICGVFGTLIEVSENKQAIPMAFKQEVHTGAAKILSTVDGSEPCEYDIVIEKINLSEDENVKSMTIRVTDEKLLSTTGGIVQGMSGSPIIQDGKLVGAVTHVFVSNPARGYAIFAQSMYESAACTVLH